VFEEKGNPVWEYEARIAELERMVGKLTMELEATKEAWRFVTSARGGNGSSPTC